jgi:hypothetical protein
MKKVIALNDGEIRVLVTRETAEKNRWWITHILVVDIIPADFLTSVTCPEPEAGNIMKSGCRFFKVVKSVNSNEESNVFDRSKFSRLVKFISLFILFNVGSLHVKSVTKLTPLIFKI